MLSYPTVRSSILSGYAEYARARGLEPIELLRGVGLPARCLAQPDLMIRVGKVNRLLELSAERSGTPLFGLQLSRTRRLSSLGALGALMRDESTVRDAMRRFIASTHLNSTAFWMQLQEHDGIALLRTAIDPDGVPLVRQGTELAVGGLFRVLQQFLGTDWTPREVHFLHDAAGGASPVRRFFGCPVRYASEFNGLVLHAPDLDHAIPLSDPALRRYASAAVAEVGPRQGRVTVHRVRQQILTLMPDGHCSASTVAASLGMDRRTLNRHLEAQGLNFLRVHDEVRLELARRYLASRQRKVSEVAELLAFNSVSSFSRWFKRKTAAAPSRWQAADGTKQAV